MSEPTAAPTCYRHPDRETWIRCQRCDRPICPDCMLPASVGFQCPSCVKEGAKSVRHPQAPYGGRLSGNGALVTFALMAVNVAVWLAISANGGNSSTLTDKLSLTPNLGVHVVNGSPAIYDGVAHGAWWQVITSVFTHVSVLHIASNMFVLFFIGPPLEQVLGRVRFLALYLVSGLGGSASVMLFANSFQATLGASGAIFGLLGALAVVTYKIGGDWRNVMTWIGLNLVFTFAVPNISWQGHLGGLVAGTIIAAGMVYAPRAQRALVQWLTVSAVALISVALIVQQAHALASSTVMRISG